MKRTFIICFGFIAVVSSALRCSAHDQPVHQAIAQSAVLSSSGFTRFLNDTLGDPNTPLLFQPREFHAAGPFPAIYWVTNGAYFEDDTPRFGNHFYTLVPVRTPGQVQGLTDWHESVIPMMRTTNSYVWSMIPGTPMPVWLTYFGPSTNPYNWEFTRAYELAALTNSAPSDRDANMGAMFFALGHILHLNEDLTSPDHVRNDEHLHPWHCWIENFGKEVYLHEPNAFPLEPHGWAYWQSQGFSKALDFWDRGLYANGSSDALNQEAIGSVKLGLAEFSNGNFLSEDSTYAEYFNSSDIHYFPFPSRTNGTVVSLGVFVLKNGHLGTNFYLSKIHDGVVVNHHSRLTSWGVKHPELMNRHTTTINDTNVWQEYHSILIPKAVEYSAGLLDYFFRGRLKVCVCPAGPDLAGLYIENKSGTNLYNGSFALFSEDNAGTRTRILTTNLSDVIGGSNSLDDGVFVSMNFTPPLENPAAYVMVYQGTIGTDDSGPLDPVDAGIAIAAKRIIPCHPDSDGPTPDTLEYPDPADAGQVTIIGPGEGTFVTNYYSFGNVGSGEYQVNYVDGAFYYVAPPPYWTMNANAFGQYYAGAFATYNYDDKWCNGVEEADSRPTAFFRGVNYWDGGYSSLEEVKTNNLAMNPLSVFSHMGNGAVFLKFLTDVPYVGGTITYQLQRVGSFYPQPTRIRIRNYAAEVEPLLTVCTNCINATGETIWDGSFNYRLLSGGQSARWYPDDTFDYLAINGKVVDYLTVYYTRIYRADSGSYVWCWNIAIWGATSDYDEELIWSGYKFTGTSPVGTYFRDADTPICADELCCLYIENY